MKKFYLILAAVICSASFAFAETTYDFETGDFEGWTTIDADGDGYCWTMGNDLSETGKMNPYSGNYLVYSESYNNDAEVALYPDNWLISPQIALGGTITLMAKGQDKNFAAEHFAIFVSTTSNTDVTAFTQVSEEFVATSEYVRYDADLSAFEGQGYIAIRHCNVSDEFSLNVDYITIYGPEEEVPVVVVPPTEVEVSGVTETTATLSWEGNAEAYDIAYIKTSDIPTILFPAESYTEWSLIDADGDGDNWFVDDDLLGSMSYDDYYRAALTPDNWIILPKTALNGTLAVVAFGMDPNYSEEHFGIYVSTTDNPNVSDFTKLGEWTVTGEEAVYSVDLNAYAGQEGYIALRHFDCTDMYALAVSAIAILAPGQTLNPTMYEVSDITDLSFELTELEPGTEYLAIVYAHDGEEFLQSEPIRFTTEGATGIDQIVNGKCENGKYIFEGNLYIRRDNRIFNAQGARVK